MSELPAAPKARYKIPVKPSGVMVVDCEILEYVPNVKLTDGRVVDRYNIEYFDPERLQLIECWVEGDDIEFVSDNAG